MTLGTGSLPPHLIQSTAFHLGSFFGLSKPFIAPGLLKSIVSMIKLTIEVKDFKGLRFLIWETIEVKDFNG